MGEDHGREANHDSGGGRGPHTAAAARDLPPAIVTHCAEQVFCFGGDGHTGATRPSTAWRFLRAAAFAGATATAPPTASWPRSLSTSTTSPPPEPLRPVPTQR